MEVEKNQVEEEGKSMVRFHGGPPPTLPWKSHLEGEMQNGRLTSP